MAPTAVTSIAPLDALRSYEAALQDYEALTSPAMVGRAVAAIDNVIRNWKGDNPIESLVDALGVTRGTVYHWRKMKRHISPAQVYRVALAYCAPDMPRTAGELDDMADLLADEAGELFNLFYSDNQRDAVNWLIEHRPANFAWNIVDQAPLVA
jgi:hypothetical protein